MTKRTTSSARAAVATLAASLLLPAGARADAQEPPETPGPNLAAKAFDVMIVRPVGLAILPIGVAAFIPAALLSAPGGMDPLREAFEHFVSGPVTFAFLRPLGEF